MSALIKKVVFVFKITNQSGVDYPTIANLIPASFKRQPVSPCDYSQGVMTLLGDGKSFISVPRQLYEAGLFFSCAYLNQAGKLVFKAISDSKKYDESAHTLFRQLNRNNGWRVAKYVNDDGSVVFAASSPCCLPDTVSCVRNGEKITIDRDWSRYEIKL